MLGQKNIKIKNNFVHFLVYSREFVTDNSRNEQCKEEQFVFKLNIFNRTDKPQ